MSTSTLLQVNPQHYNFTIWAKQKSTSVQKPAALELSRGVESFVTEEKPFSDILHFFDRSDVVNTIVHDVRPAGNLYYKESLILKFSLTDKFAEQFSLLRGLLGFGKWDGLSILSDTGSKTFQLVVSAGQTENAIHYFERLFLDITKEIRFKTALKSVLKAQQEATRILKISQDNLIKSLD